MRTVIYVGLLAVADAINKDWAGKYIGIYAAILVGAILMDVYEFVRGKKWIAPNCEGISDVADFLHQSRYEAPQLIKNKMFNRSKSAAILLIPC